MKSTKTRCGECDVLLPPPALQAQREHTELAGGAVFHNPRTDEPWTIGGAIRKTARTRILRRDGIRYRTAYQTRHTYASNLLSTGENPMWVAQQMGHADWAMLRKVYGRWIPEVDASAGQKVMAMFGEPCDRPVTKATPVCKQTVAQSSPSPTTSDQGGADTKRPQPLGRSRSGVVSGGRRGIPVRPSNGGGRLTAELGPRSAVSDPCRQVRISASLRVGNCPESPEGCGCGEHLLENFE